MSICKICNRAIKEVSDGDLKDNYCEQANFLGIESLTENQQMLVNRTLCEECYNELESK